MYTNGMIAGTLGRSPLGVRIAFTIKTSASCPLRATSACLACNTNCDLQIKKKHLEFIVVLLAQRFGGSETVLFLHLSWPLFCSRPMLGPLGPRENGAQDALEAPSLSHDGLHQRNNKTGHKTVEILTSSLRLRIGSS